MPARGALNRMGTQPPVPAGAGRRLRILIINQSFWPDVVATAQQAHDLAKHLAQVGDDVTVVASRSLYGKPGATLPKRETVDGIQVIRVSSNFFEKRGLGTRSIDYLRFNITCFLKALTLPKQDVVICLTTPPFVALVGAALAWLRGSKFVFWTMDLYPDLPVEAGIISRGSIGHRFFKMLDSFCLKQADRVVVLGRCMRDRVLAKGVRPEKVEMIHPWSDPKEILELPPSRADAKPGAGSPPGPAERAPAPANKFRKEWEIGDRFVIQYSGNYGLGHDVHTVQKAMLALKDDDGVRWVIVGDGIVKPAIEEFVAKHRIRNVLLKPYQPRSDLGSLISLGDMHLVLMVPGFEGVILPSKFYGVLAAGRPVVFVGPTASEVARVIEEERCGFVVANGRTDLLLEAISKLRADPALATELGHRGRQTLERRYSMQDACAAWSALLHHLVPLPADRGSQP